MNEKLTLQDITALLAKQAKISKKDAESFLKELFALISENILDNESVSIKDFGTFKPTLINSRESVNVNTGEKIRIPAHIRLTFSPDKALKELVNKPFSAFETTLLYDGNDVLPNNAINIEQQAEEIVVDEYSDDNDFSDNEDMISEETITNDIRNEEPVLEDEEQPSGEAIEHDEAPQEETTITDAQSEVIEDTLEAPQAPATNNDIQDAEAGKERSPLQDIIFESDSTKTVITLPVSSPAKPKSESDKNLSLSKEQKEQLHDTSGNNNPSDEYNLSLGEYDIKPGFWYKVKHHLPIILLSLVLISGVAYAFYRLFNRTQHTPAIIPTEGFYAIPDSLFLDSLAANIQSASDSVQGNIAEPDKTPINSNQAVLDTLNKGGSLRTLATKHYGNKIFWVYIFQENKDKIKNPNVLNVGTVLRIPDLKKYTGNQTAEDALKQAKDLELEIENNKTK
ncbi:nucleoid DNA-binding protein/nucleoid-associated protein YgaU [Dysgonomonas sp. PH5-45]|uniref:HU family DNA-binding protein n=1 Tax=unclassified Dysgonomonas TaxID=2630389 RepID=UPI0024737AF9|nr:MULTISPECIES: HU family DNA-binding protein [unclassified Dysgonomonas]MDH6354919.1 nucleoid DNA-binding protein/nucleoid-associated protein YgaU [Dysgonomonas sp. PH5-45]MDH6387818.1 nucleoid DNA-binding protein/nucleoid-associated protein YgaU [Dysgonomonas sp. PH5-37]